MLANYYTLVHVARFFDQTFSNSVISEIYSQYPDQLCIGATLKAEKWTMVISCASSQNYIYSRKGSFRAQKNSVDLLKRAAQSMILGVRAEENDRVITVRLNDEMLLRIEMFGQKANVLLGTKNAGENFLTVLDSFLKKSEMQKKTIPIPTLLRNRAIDEEKYFIESIRAKNSETMLQALKRTAPVLGTTLIKESLYRSGIESLAMVQSLGDVELKRVHHEVYGIIDTVSRPERIEPRIYSGDHNPLCMSLIPLRMYDGYRFDVFPDISSAIYRFVAQSSASSAFAKEKQTIVQWLEKEQGKIERTLAKINEEEQNKSRAEEYELFGKLLTANLHRLRKGMKEINLPRTLSNEDDPPIVTIPLDPSFSPIQNAQRYFEKRKKMAGTKEESLQRKQTLTHKMNLIETLTAKIDELYNHDEIKNFLKDHKEDLHSIGFKTAKEEQELPPFRTFIVDGGFQVFVGKSGENNDLLTLKHAKPDDLWFHCRGSSGSHVVLKISTGKGEPGKAAIMQAASLAAYYSKMKNASLVPVAMTEKKYVHKPKGSPAGTVTIEREKVLLVPPKLPQELHRKI